jgi:glucose-6-phosphate-specific signal transduction histidine kinase
MYLSGHVLTSTLVSEIACKKGKFEFRVFLAIMVACNLLDADHLWGYGADDGTASSFSLYLMHRFWWVVVALPAIAAMLFRRLRPWLIPLAAGLLLHYCMDALADLSGYNLTFLMAADLVVYAVVILCDRWYGAGRRRLFRFATMAMFVPWLALAALKYGFMLDPSQTPVYHIVNLALNVGFVLWAWFGLRKVRTVR